MSEQLKSALLEALEDEYKARATYRLILQKFGAIRPFVNIIQSEERHITALVHLFGRYGIPVPDDNWEQKVVVLSSIQEACEAGVLAEIENGQMYQRLLDLTPQYPDVQQVFFRLQEASQVNHLRAFQRCTERGGASTQHGKGGRRGMVGDVGSDRPGSFMQICRRKMIAPRCLHESKVVMKIANLNAVPPHQLEPVLQSS